MLALRLQLHQVYDIDDAHFQFGSVTAQQVDGGERLQCWHVAAAGHYDVRLVTPVVAGPFPNPKAGIAVLDRLVHGQPLRRRLLAGNDDIDEIAAAQAVVGHRKQTIGVGRQINADDFGLLVDDMVDEAGILVAEAVVILAPNVAGQQIIKRGDRPPPANMIAHLQPLGVLVEHRVDDMNECLVA